MRRRGSALSIVLYSVGGLGILGTGAVMLQGTVSSALNPGEIILLGFQVIILGAVGITYAQGRNGENRASTGRKLLHERIDRIVEEQTKRHLEQATAYGRLLERSDTFRDDFTGMSLRIEAVGSKITNQVEKALLSRQEENDRRFEEIIVRIRDLEQKK